MTLVQRTDLALGSDRKSYTDWILKQGFTFDQEIQPQTRQMAIGISQVTGTVHYGESYVNKSGNIHIRLFTDTTFRILQIQISLVSPASGEGDNFITSLKTIGYRMDSRYTNREDQSDNCLLSKDGRRFIVIRAPGNEYLLVKATLTSR